MKERTPVRVCMVCGTFPPDICGVGDNTSHLVHFLQQQGINVTVFTSQKPMGSLGPAPKDPNIRRIFRRWNLRMVIRMIREIRAASFEIVHIQYTPQMYGSRTFAIAFLPWFVRVLTGQRVFVTCHEIYTPFINDLRQNLLIFLNRIKDTILLAGCTGVIVSLPRRADRLKRLFPWKKNRIHVVPIGPNIVPELSIPDGPKNGRAERRRHRDCFGVPEGGMLLSSFGMLHIDKRYDLLFKCMRRLIDKGERVYLMLIGAYSSDHPYYRYLQKCVDDLDLKPYIIWTGTGTSAEVSAWLSMTDIYVMTDIRGASARKSSLLSALSHGLPVVSNPGSDTEDTFVDGENIVLVPQEDEETFVDRISRLVHAPEERSRIGANARQLYESSYAWEILTERNIELYFHYASRI